MALVFGIGLDGSNIAYRGLDVLLTIAREDRGDRIVCVHVPDAARTSVATIKGEADAKCTRLGPGAFEWVEAPKTPGDSTTQVLMRVFEAKGAQYIVLGAWGRKGEANLATGEHEGHSAEELLHSVPWATSMLIKPTSPVPKESKVIMMCTDFSTSAKIAFERMLKELATPADKVIVLHVTSMQSFARRITEWHDERLKNAQIEGNVIIRDHKAMHLFEFVCAVSDEVKADFLVLGWQGHCGSSTLKHSIGSFASGINKKSYCTVVNYKASD